MRRREFIAGLGSAAAWPLMARAQQPAMAVVGILSLGRKTQNSPELTGLRRGLAEHGFVEGRNISLEVRAANNNNNLLPALALDLVEHRSAVIVALGSPNAVTAAKAASATVPIAFVTAVDPVDNGFVASLNRPGGNATGLSVLSTELIGKRLGLLLELAPKVKTIGYLSGPSNSPVFEDWRARTIAAAQALGRDIIVQAVRPNRDFETVFAMFVERQVSVMTVGDFTVFSERRNLNAIVALAARHRIPAIYGSRLYTVNGGLMSYGADGPYLYQLAMQYVGPMLKGTKPADLPVQQPTKFRLVINLKTANAMGLDVPRILLAAADEVID